MMDLIVDGYDTFYDGMNWQVFGRFFFIGNEEKMRNRLVRFD